MSVAITIRNVPEEVRDELAARAARSGRSLQEYLLRELTSAVSHPTVEEVTERARRRLRVEGGLALDGETILGHLRNERR